MCSSYTMMSSLSHVAAIEEIVQCARCELELEEQFYSIEEEWNEQVINMQSEWWHGTMLKYNRRVVWKSNSFGTFRGVHRLHLSFHSGATVQFIQVSWSSPPGWGSHPLSPGAAGACPDTASHNAHVPSHSASEGRGLPVGHQASHHCRGAPSGERRERHIQVVCKFGSLRFTNH